MQPKNQEVIQDLLIFMPHYLFWGIDELKRIYVAYTVTLAAIEA